MPKIPQRYSPINATITTRDRFNKAHLWHQATIHRRISQSQYLDYLLDKAEEN